MDQGSREDLTLPESTLDYVWNVPIFYVDGNDNYRMDWLTVDSGMTWQKDVFELIILELLERSKYFTNKFLAVNQSKMNTNKVYIISSFQAFK